MQVALNSVFLFAFGLPLLLVDLYPHRFLSVSKHKIQPELNVPLPPKLLSPLLAGMAARARLLRAGFLPCVRVWHQVCGCDMSFLLGRDSFICMIHM